MNEISDLRERYLVLINSANSDSELEQVRIGALGKKGEIALKMRELGKISPEERQIAGPALNALKDEFISGLSAKKSALSDAALNPNFTKDELDKEKDKLVTGLKSEENSPAAISQRVTGILTYSKDHPYGEFTTENTYLVDASVIN